MFFVYMLLARFLGPALYGIFGYTLTTVQIISGVLFDVGLFLIVTRELSVGNDSIFLPSIWLKMAGCLLDLDLDRRADNRAWQAQMNRDMFYRPVVVERQIIVRQNP